LSLRKSQASGNFRELISQYRLDTHSEVHSTSWLSASLSPDDDVVLSLGKKHPKDTDRVSVQIDETATQALDDLTTLLERAFELEA